MLIVISPAKTLDYETLLPIQRSSQPALLQDSQELIDDLKKLSPPDITRLMQVSENLAIRNYERFQAWARPFNVKNARQALLAFKGDVYTGMNAYSFSNEDFAFAQDHLRMVSGLYGLLRPLDLIQPYRLEMGTRLATARGDDLYAFWGDRITRELNKQIKTTGSKYVINLASHEYFKAVKPAELSAPVITPAFKDWRNGTYKIISIFAKKMRGVMSAYIIQNKLKNVNDIKKFDMGGYSYDAGLSTDMEWVFTRRAL